MFWVNYQIYKVNVPGKLARYSGK